ncbi:MAG: OmpH family outer membrane protein [Polyangia bacterium]|jgi:outer membrane protein|nr:OmpH family outer membrane protein [Polyangia bacterium]
MRKSLLFFLITSLVGLALPGLAEAKVGVVSFEDVLSKTRQGVKIGKEIEAFFKRKQASIDRKKANLQQEEKNIVTAFKQLEASKTILKEAVFKQRKAALEENYRKLLLQGQTLMQQVNEENNKLQQKRVALLQPLRTVFLSTVEAVAKAKGFDLIIERSAVYFHKGLIDVTGDVVQRIDASTKP